jgi:signal transduction histidine kinase
MIVLPALLLGVGAYWLPQMLLTREVKARLVAAAERENVQFSRRVDDLCQQVPRVAQCDVLRRWCECRDSTPREGTEVVRALLGGLRQPHIGYTLFDTAGTILCSSGRDADLDSATFACARRGQTVGVIPWARAGRACGEFQLHVPMRGNNGQICGILVAYADLLSLFELTMGTSGASSNRLTLIDFNARRLVANGLHEPATGPDPCLKDLTTHSEADRNAVRTYKDNRGIDVLGTVSWLRGMGLGILVERDRTDAFAALIRWRWALLLAVIMVTATALGMGMLLVNRMVRTLEQREAELWTIHEQLITADRLASVGMMAASVAHEVNNPLTTIRVLIHSVHEQLTPTDPRRADLDVVQAEIDKIRALILRLLQFAKPREPEFASVQLNDVLARVVDLIRPQAQMQNVTLVENYEALPPLWVDGSQLGQVFLNILLNAFEAVPQGGSIRVTTHAVGHDGVGATVWNSGPGLAPGLEERIFEPFFTTKATGTGLGLSIARMIVDNHHGTIRAVGHGPDGTSFRITLPLGASEGASDGKRPTSRAGG